MKEGIEAYIIESNLKVRKVTVAHVTGNLATVRFEEGGGIRVPINRLYGSEDEAAKELKYKTEAKKPPHNYLNGQLL